MKATTANAKIAGTTGISKIHTGLPLMKTVMGPSYFVNFAEQATTI